jgi:hypothetical protein
VALLITQGERVLCIVIPVEHLYGTVNETVFVTYFGLGGITYALAGLVAFSFQTGQKQES